MRSQPGRIRRALASGQTPASRRSRAPGYPRDAIGPVLEFVHAVDAGLDEVGGADVVAEVQGSSPAMSSSSLTSLRSRRWVRNPSRARGCSGRSLRRARLGAPETMRVRDEPTPARAETRSRPREVGRGSERRRRARPGVSFGAQDALLGRETDDGRAIIDRTWPRRETAGSPVDRQQWSGDNSANRVTLGRASRTSARRVGRDHSASLDRPSARVAADALVGATGRAPRQFRCNYETKQS